MTPTLFLGKTTEYLVLSRLLKEQREAYLPAVDDHGVDVIVRTRHKGEDEGLSAVASYEFASEEERAACLAEEYNDEGGLKLPVSVAPYQVHLVSLVKETEIADKIYEDLQKAGIEVLYDDRKETAGVKFADADLIGIPLRITLGNRSLKEGKVEVKIRETGETTSFLLEDIAEEIKAEIAREQAEIDRNIVNKTLD